MDIVSFLNWIDIFILAIMARIAYLGMKSNLVVELFKTLGSLVTTFITLHYYNRFGLFLHEKLFMPEMVHQVFAFVLLWFTVYLIFKFITEGWTTLIKIEAHKIIDKWCGMIISLVRSVVIIGLVFIVFLLSGSDYLRTSSINSFTGFYMIDVSPNIYKYSYDAFVSKFFEGEPLNEAVFELKEADKKKKKKKRK